MRAPAGSTQLHDTRRALLSQMKSALNFAAAGGVGRRRTNARGRCFVYGLASGAGGDGWQMRAAARPVHLCDNVRPGGPARHLSES